MNWFCDFDSEVIILTCIPKLLEMYMGSICKHMDIWSFIYFFLMVKKLISVGKKPKSNQNQKQDSWTVPASAAQRAVKHSYEYIVPRNAWNMNS